MYLSPVEIGIDQANADGEQLMRCACRVMVRLERCGIAGRTNMGARFTISVSDPEENLLEATDRLNSVHAEFND